MNRLIPSLLVLALVGCHAGNGHADPHGGVPVAGYCEAFAQAFCEKQALGGAGEAQHG